jgi:hypothetical protein
VRVLPNAERSLDCGLFESRYSSKVEQKQFPDGTRIKCRLPDISGIY